MKKLLIFGLILAILILAMPQGVLAADIIPPSPVVVTANVDTVIVCTATFPEGELLLTRGPNVFPSIALPLKRFTFTVTSTNNWDLDAEDSVNTGYMEPTVDAKPDDAIALISAFNIGTTDMGGYSPLTDMVLIAQGSKGDTPAFYRGLSQDVSNDDFALTDGTYKITIQFTCVNTDLIEA